MKPCRVTWPKKVDTQLSRIPAYLRDKFLAWAMAVERIGMDEVRKLPGYHDEPLKGERKGQRSIRLNRGYRAIYLESESRVISIVEVIEVSKHGY